MRQSVSAIRVLSFAILATATLVGTTGCFKRGARGDYALAPEMRPLEVPPDLNTPGNNPAAQVPVLASQAAKPAPSTAGRRQQCRLHCAGRQGRRVRESGHRAGVG
jgi:uncharacterized lipoprotein